tara:strand:+ start:186 stop:584 length:399 start_codon:yes stop_codon:yes gene_type:complete
VENWLLHILVFIFGYVTCTTFYFLRANRISLSLIKLAHIVYLSCVIKAIETLVNAKLAARKVYIESDADKNSLISLENRVDSEIKILKDNSIAYLLQAHPRFYREALKFDNWQSSMTYLKENKDAVFKFWNK